MLLLCGVHAAGLRVAVELSILMYTVCFIFAACSPACQNGGICRSSYYFAYCVCPRVYRGSYCQNRGAHNQELACMHAAIGPWSVCTLCVSYLQLVIPPVRMEEHAVVHLTLPTVSVPVGTKDPTVRTEVHTTKNMLACMLQFVHGVYVHCVFHICSL